MIADTASIHIEADIKAVFSYISDPAKLDRWSLGTWRNILHPGGLVEGRSLATGAKIMLRIDADPDRMLVDYHLGSEPSTLLARIFARVIPGPVADYGPNTTLLLLTALRGAHMDEFRWAALCRAHAAELDIIKGQIETGYDHRA